MIKIRIAYPTNSMFLDYRCVKVFFDLPSYHEIHATRRTMLFLNTPSRLLDIC
jgi:hypothetical protein